MINLLKFQFRNLYKQISTCVLIAIPLLLCFITSKLDPYTGYNSIIELYSDYIRFGVFEIIFICLFMNLDSSNQITKNIVSRGYSRISLFFSKFIVVTIVLITLTIVKCTFINFFILDPNYWTNLEQIIILILPQITFYVTLSALFNRNSISIALCLTINLIIEILICLLTYIIFVEILDNIYSVIPTTTKLLSYWVTSLHTLNSVPKMLCASILWTTLLTSLSVFVVNKKEIK